MAANVAVTLRAWVIAVIQLPVPEQAPDQPVNVDPGTGDAVNVTDNPQIPWLYNFKLDFRFK